MGQFFESRAALVHALGQLGGVQGVGQAELGFSFALQWSALAGAALVYKHQVTAVVEAGHRTLHGRYQVHGTLARASGQKVNRVLVLLPGLGGHHRKLNLHLFAAGVLGVERPGQATALHGVPHTRQVTGFSGDGLRLYGRVGH